MPKYKQPKLLVVGSLVMDLITTTDRVPETGETVIGTTFQQATGGKGQIRRFKRDAWAPK